MSSGLDRLVEDIMKESRARAGEIRKEGLAQIQDSIARARADAIGEADQITRNVRRECGAVVNRRVSQEKQKARLLCLAEKNRVLDEVMKEVRARLLEFCRDDSSYRPFLLKSIARGMESVPSERIKVFVSQNDLRRYKRSKILDDAVTTIKANRKAVFSDQPIVTIGGAVVSSQDEKIRVDCTIEARLELTRPRLLAEISKILFLAQS
jgi:vacuolar-type H+-ATPase subunit E/Vma4